MNELMPVYQNDAGNTWQNQLGNKGAGLGGKPPGR